MGCGSSTATTANNVSGNVAPVADIVSRELPKEAAKIENEARAESHSAALIATGAGAAVGALMHVDYLEKMQSVMDQFEGFIDVDSPAVDLIKETLVAAEEVIKFAADVAVPPPGGTIIAAAIAITAMVIKGAMNVAACKELAIRCNRLVRIAFPSEALIAEKGPDYLREQMQLLKKACDEVHAFVQEVLDQGWLKKMLTWKSTADQIVSLNKELDEAQAALDTAVNLANFKNILDAKHTGETVLQLVAQMHEAGAKVDEFVARHGGAANVSDNEELLQQLIETANGVDGVLLDLQYKGLNQMRTMSKKMDDMMLQMQGALRASAADADEGPHNIIEHDNLKTLWREKFYPKEKVDWDTFFAVFPRQTPSVDVDDIKVLSAELDDDGRMKMKLVCDEDEDNQISVTELCKAFPRSTSLVDQVRALKQQETRRKGLHDGLPPLPLRIFGRSAEVSQIYEALKPKGPSRMVLVVGGPGEGKLTTASEALRRLYDEGKAVGGVWRCNMAGVTSEQDLVSRFITGLTRTPKADDKETGGESSFKARLSEFARRNVDLYVLIDDCEYVTSKFEEKFTYLLVQMVKEVPKLKLVVSSRESFDFRDVASALRSEPVLLTLSPLPLDEGTAMVLESGIPRIKPAEAQKISANFNANPLMLNIIIDALKTGRITIDQALDGTGLATIAEGDKQIDKALAKVEESMKRSLEGLTPDYRTLALKMAVMLPGTIDYNVLSRVLGIPTSKAKVALEYLKKAALLDVTGKGFKVSPMLRETAEKIYKDEARAAKHGMSPEEMKGAWKKFVDYVLEVVKKDFRQYKSAPEGTYGTIQANKPTVQNALRLVLNNLEAAEASIKQLLEIVGYLPYLGMVHDGALVLDACDQLCITAESAEALPEEERVMYQGLCKAVRAHFAPSTNGEQQKEVLPMVDEVKDLLGEPTDAKAQLVLATALRRKGVVLRDLGKYEESVEALREAKYLVENTGQSSDQAKLELILTLTELAGTLDYMGDMTQGMPIAQEALTKAQAFYGEDTSHPVTALCLTTYGYYLKGNGNGFDKAIQEAQASGATEEAEEAKKARTECHKQAIDVNLKAKKMREEVLGKTHLEVALSYQQMGISYTALGQFKDAEEALNHSLHIRHMNLREDHFLLANTYRELAALYKAWEQPPKQEQSLRRMISVGKRCWGPKHKKTVNAAKDLVGVLQNLDRTDDAKKCAEEFGL